MDIRTTILLAMFGIVFGVCVIVLACSGNTLVPTLKRQVAAYENQIEAQKGLIEALNEKSAAYERLIAALQNNLDAMEGLANARQETINRLISKHPSAVQWPEAVFQFTPTGPDYIGPPATKSPEHKPEQLP